MFPGTGLLHLEYASGSLLFELLAHVALLGTGALCQRDRGQEKRKWGVERKRSW